MLMLALLAQTSILNCPDASRWDHESGPHTIFPLACGSAPEWFTDQVRVKQEDSSFGTF